MKFNPDFQAISMTTFNDRDSHLSFMSRNSPHRKYYVKHPHEKEKVLFPKVEDMS